MKQLYFAIISVFFSIAFSSCDSKDGDWDPIEVTIDGKYIKKNTIDVPTEGGTYVMTSRNYGVPWLVNIMMDGKFLWDYDDIRHDYAEKGLTFDWLHLETSQQKGYTITFQANTTTTDRTAQFKLECGDAFGSFIFVQKAHE